MTSYRTSSKTKIDWNIRFFRRYPREIPFNLKIKDRIFEAKTVDYCPIGVGIVINNPNAPLNKGDLIDLNIKGLDLHERAKAAWVDEIPSGLRVGVQRIESLKGRFNIYPLSDTLIGLQRTSRTGILEVRYHSLKEKLFFRNGNIILAQSSYEKDRLIDVLLKSRKINRRQYDRAAEMQRKTISNYAAILVHMGYITQQDLRYALELQAKRIIMRLFLMKDAEFEFTEGPFRGDEVMTLKLSIANLVFREVKKNADVELLESYLLDNVVYYSLSRLNLFKEIRFTAFDRSVISHVDGKRSIREIVNLSASPGRVNPLKIIFALLEARFLKIMEKRETPAEPDPSSFEDQQEESDTLSDEIERLYSNYKDLDYYSVLGISSDSTEEEIQKAYDDAAKKYHPDKHRYNGEEATSKLTELFTHITNAYLTLANKQKRKDYDSYFLKRSSVSEMSGPAGMQEDVQSQDSLGSRFDPSQSWNPHIAEQHFKDGKTAYWGKKIDEAANLFMTAIHFDPSVAKYHYYYGCALLSLNNPKKAVEALNRADELKPLDVDILAELGHAYLKLKFPLRAKSYFDKAINLSPSNKRALEGIQTLTSKKTKSQKPD